ncbi:head-tail connector protein [Pontivivens nitratireducens]|uniref:head-tail connector protein n=1 Tax=Pontivivens nitratireducens TaxID=2758038 RepID=UPI00163AF0CE|nr:head-tail connector protein [Pontibrevibacter nitratireducens]
MSMVTVDQLEAHLNLTGDEDEDATVLAQVLNAAEGHVERLLGFTFADTYGGDGQDDLPAPLVQAVLMLAAWWHDQREAAVSGVTVTTVPFGVSEIITEYRGFTF